ncbi:hypothetical protein BDV28DRAFT_128145 [Aspergillus coremiiformis]|uniref:Nucleotide-diphospho-sugar transferase n=1 Tax=Aspergillus coremiiformis TaxID=138285 RepID=A0A5N6ZE48_9EURO|nr:hypothetical protein BDV28DRAFT_128145 [Aspergillus coremiiformis]
MAMLLSYHLSRLAKLSIAGTITFWCIALIVYFHPARLTTLAHIEKPSDISQTPKIPEKIWYKVGPKGQNDQAREWMEDCLRKNPAYRSEILTDHTAELFVKEHFAFRPDIIETYFALPLPIHQADFLRYLILFIEGGIWFDLDVSCEDTPISDWIPSEFKDEANLLVGWEFDVGWGERVFRQIQTWTVMAVPRSRHLLRVIDDIVDAVRESQDGDMVNADVVDFTGPRRFTRGVFKSLELAINGTIDYHGISHLLAPRLIGDVVLMPGYSFSASVNKYDAGDVVGPSLVKHHYAGSWKNQYGGEMP